MTVQSLYVIIFALAGVLIIILVGSYLEKRRDPREDFWDELFERFRREPESILLDYGPMKPGDFFFLGSPEKIPVGILDEFNECEVIKVGNTKRYTHWSLFNMALNSGRSVILSHHFSDELAVKEYLRMKQIADERNIHWIEVGDNIVAIAKTQSVLFIDGSIIELKKMCSDFEKFRRKRWKTIASPQDTKMSNRS